MRHTASPPFDTRAAAAELARRDRRLGRLIARVGECRLAVAPARVSPYAALAEAIVYQQLHGRAAAAIWRRLTTSFGRSGAPAARRLAVADLEALRAVGLSRNKALALQDLARRAVARQIPGRAAAERLDDEALVEQLTAVRGVGRWTVEMLLLFTLGRPDILPVGDFGVRKGFALAYGREAMPTPHELQAHGEGWRPFRSVASWYLWRALDTP
ncbi:MAG: DNA-3-methyladenine glycosylase 2 family protein [Holophagales bacterium]|nr:MAG: DNA-3-methyladenine glycosylase 2 family protein [Holophagales bacterium]